MSEELLGLRAALKNLLDACYQADGAENLSEEIDGSLLDAAAEALELQYPIIWTPEQVAMLEKRQADATLHPYTCGGDRSDWAHQWHAGDSGEEAGLLYPTVRGWKCPACEYRQFWAHETGGLSSPPAKHAPADGMREAIEGGAAAKFWFEIGFGAAWAVAYIETGEAPFDLSDARFEAEFPKSIEAYDGDLIADLRAALSTAQGEGA